MTGSAALVGAGACAGYVGNAFYPSTTSPPTPPRPPASVAAMSDGSQLLLDARSRVNLDFTPAYRQVRLLDGAVTVSVAPDARRPFLVQTAEGTVRALGTRYMVRQQAQRTVVVVHEHEVEVETMSGAHGTVRAGTGARFDALRMDTPRAELMAEAAWEAGWIDVRGRPLAEVIAALRPYRSGSLRISMAAGGLPVSGHFRWTTPTPPCARCRRACPSISAATPLVRVDQRRDLNRHLLATCCPAGPSRCILATAFLPAFLPQQAPPGFPGSRDKRHGRPGHPRNFPRGSRPEPPPWRSRPTIGRHRLDGTLSLQSPGTCYNVRLCRIQLTDTQWPTPPKPASALANPLSATSTIPACARCCAPPSSAFANPSPPATKLRPVKCSRKPPA